ncbi:Six-hairpin glycosidase [Lentinula aff. detonsa]|uniref:Six-hairpin glycosidase n=1 Tax=Lentinula aff. detonsa TaxID=2804958 RepID=A0AA38KMY7_9AGAR|nr:Six-hairpin glycosidase [Lentinula aff. detonsa]KAJ3798307.1 Six-hairpin glycosidase [Lentinula aff. detonsa]
MVKLPTRVYLGHRTLCTLLLLLQDVASAQNLTNSQISDVEMRLAEGATHPWELGTRAQALLEHDVQAFSVFSLIIPSTSVPSNTSSAIAPVFSIAKGVVNNRTASNGNITGPQPLVADDSAADPASIGTAVLLANWTNLGDGVDYAGAALDQLNFLYEKVPKTSDGAISHRTGEVQLWSDFVYMVPPFIAYYGLLTNNQSLITDAYTQIKLYRNYLRDTSAGNLWAHIVLGTNPSGVANDPGHWSTGNAWAAAGMLRVLATIQSSPFASDMSSEQDDLADWVFEIQTAMYPHLDTSSNLFFNYADEMNTFSDAASTALLASTVYRLSLLRGVHHYLPDAEKCRQSLFSSNSSGLVHFSSDGWLTPVVNPDSFGDEGSDSPESQAFILELQAAWTDWVNDGSQGANGASRSDSVNEATIVVAALSVFWMLLL